MASTIFRKGVIYDCLVGQDWMSIRDINRKVGGTLGSTNKACLAMFNEKILEKNGRCELRLRKYRLRDGVQRPKDGRGAPAGVVRVRTDRKDGTLGWNYASIELEKGVVPAVPVAREAPYLTARQASASASLRSARIA